MHVAEPVQQAFGLRAHRRDDARVRVSHVRDAEAGREVDEAVAVDVPDVGALRALPEDGRWREARDAPALARGEATGERERARAGHGRQEAGREGLERRHDAGV